MRDSISDEANYKYVFGYVLALCIGSVQFGISNVDISFFDINKRCGVFINSKDYDNSCYIVMTWINLGASLLGCLLVAFCMSVTAKRKQLLIANFVLLIAAAAKYFLLTKDTTIFIYGIISIKSLQSFSAGMLSTIVPVYIKEITPLALSVSMNAAHNFMIFVGIFIVYVSHRLYFLNPEYTAIIDLCLCISQILAFLFYFTNESPRECIRMGQIERGEQELRKVYYDPYKIQNEMDELRAIFLEENAAGRLTFRSLCTTNWRNSFAIGCLILLFQQTTGILITLLDPIIINENEYIKASDEIWILLGRILLPVLVSFGSIFYLYEMDRKLILWGGQILLCIPLLGISATIMCLYWLEAITEINLYMNAFLTMHLLLYAGAYGGACWIYACQILPDIGFAWAMVVNRLSACALSIFAIISMTDDADPKNYVLELGKKEQKVMIVAYLFFAIISLLASMVFYNILEETRGKTSKEIEFLYSSIEQHSSHIGVISYF